VRTPFAGHLSGLSNDLSGGIQRDKFVAHSCVVRASSRMRRVMLVRMCFHITKDN
jgi:hypothetical protein